MSHQYKVHMTVPQFHDRQGVKYALCGQVPGYEFNAVSTPSHVTCKKCVAVIKHVARRAADDVGWIGGKVGVPSAPSGATHTFQGTYYRWDYVCMWWEYYNTDTGGWTHTDISNEWASIHLQPINPTHRTSPTIEDLYQDAVMILADLRRELAKIRKKHKKTKTKLAHCEAMLAHEKMFNPQH